MVSGHSRLFKDNKPLTSMPPTSPNETGSNSITLEVRESERNLPAFTGPGIYRKPPECSLTKLLYKLIISSLNSLGSGSSIIITSYSKSFSFVTGKLLIGVLPCCKRPSSRLCNQHERLTIFSLVSNRTRARYSQLGPPDTNKTFALSSSTLTLVGDGGELSSILDSPSITSALTVNNFPPGVLGV